MNTPTLLIVGGLAVIGAAYVFGSFSGPIVLNQPTESGAFQVAGTLDFTENSTGQAVSYIVYKMPSGQVATKALVFGNGSQCETNSTTYPCALIADALPTYFGTRPVQVVGTVDAEHINVSELAIANEP